ncbi:hypothetical protein J6590_065388 [Homalodisca vitripennis]|nr:hypothetical protein J6590_065388 [Homalodisca vitripennis]
MLAPALFIKPFTPTFHFPLNCLLSNERQENAFTHTGGHSYYRNIPSKNLFYS